MPFQITNSSSHPNAISFDQWISEKKSQALQSGNTAEADKIQTALDLKAASISNINQQTVGYSQGTLIIKSDTVHPTVPEFDFYHNQWVQEFNVQISFEEVTDNPGIQSETLETAPPPTE